MQTRRKTRDDADPQWEQALKRVRLRLGDNVDDERLVATIAEAFKSKEEALNEERREKEEALKSKEESDARVQQLEETIFTNGLLELTKSCWGATTEATSKRHKSCEVKDGKFGQIRAGIVKKQRFPSVARNRVDGEAFGDIDCSEERGLASRIRPQRRDSRARRH